MTRVDSARAVVESAIAEFGGSLAVLTSFQREGVVIVDLVLQASRDIPILTIDTGRLPVATDQMIGKVERRYGIAVERILPDREEVEAMVAAHGINLFRDSVPQRMLCCNIRKVRPLGRRVQGIGAYFSGMRRDQSEARENIEVFDRSGSPVKINPLADWMSADVASYTATRNLPEHPLYALGYSSIGCDPCTRAVVAGEDERAGRWWWETDTEKECGIHFSADGKAERSVDVLLRDLLAVGGRAT